MPQPSRRPKGVGSVDQLHNHGTCPAAVDGVRPSHKCRGSWRGRSHVRIDGRKVAKVMYGPTKSAVEAKLKKLSVAGATGSAVLNGGMTVAAWLDIWYAEAAPNLKVNTLRGYRSQIKTNLKPAIGHLRLTALRPQHISAMYAGMRARGLSETTCRHTHTILSRALKVAQRQRLVAVNVCTQMDGPSTISGVPRRPLSVADAWAVLRLTGDNPRYWVALLTGIRQGEALALRWCDVYLDPAGRESYLVTRRSLSREVGVGLVFGTPKSAKSRDREVPLVTMLAARLAVHRAHAFAAGADEMSLVFPSPVNGGPMDNVRDYNGWCALLNLAGVEHVALHAARNTTAALLEDAGTPPRLVAEILGHVHVATTYGYQAGNLEGKDAAMRQLDAYMVAHEPAPAART